MIYETKAYIDDDGKSITAYIPTEETDEKQRHEGTVGVRTPMGVQPLHFPFPDELTLEECFEKFEEVADVEVKKIMEEYEKKQQEENLIITPGETNTPPDLKLV